MFYSEGHTREVGFTVSKKVGNAVVRNRAKRQIRSVFIEMSESLRDGRYIFVAKPTMANAEFTQIKENIKRLTNQYILKGI